MIPGLILVGFYIIYILVLATIKPELAPSLSREELLEGKEHQSFLSRCFEDSFHLWF